MYAGISIYYAESMETIGDNLREVRPTLFTTVPRLLEKVYEKIMNKGTELTGLKKQLFFWAVSLGKRYDNVHSGGLWYQLQLKIARKLIFKKWQEALGGNVQYLITGGAACPIHLLRIFNAAGIPVFEGYGPTENSPVISVNCAKKGGTMFGTTGLVIEGQEVKLLEDGEICVKGPSVMMGYYKRSDLTEEVIIDGWLHTGDIGKFNEYGHLMITDRKKELFKTSGGKYVAPQVIENKLKESPLIEQAMSVGDGKKFVSALIIPNMDYLKKKLTQMEVHFNRDENILAQPESISLIQKAVDKANAGLNPVEQVKKFVLLEKPWTIEAGELTPKMSLRRKKILENYRSQIETMYSG
jgi:long-chain acyl-CoA synthetase